MMAWKNFGAIWDICPECNVALSTDGYATQCCPCGWENGTDEDDYDVEFPADELGGHQDVWIEVDGHQQRVLGDPNMSEETKQALAEMIKAVQNGNFKKKE